MFVRAVRDACEQGHSADGVPLVLVERQIRANFMVECDPRDELYKNRSSRKTDSQ